MMGSCSADSMSGWFAADDGNLADFRASLDKSTEQKDVPLAIDIQKNIPIYDGAKVELAASNPDERQAYLQEWLQVFADGAGVLVIKQGVSDIAAIDRASEIFAQIIEDEKQQSGGGGDHFAQAGKNDRIWNALEKHCLYDADNFTRYFASHSIAMAAESWLGAAYQTTTQVNRVNPGGAAQKPHRDYHLGFMPTSKAATYPIGVHLLSPYLTLQGAIAHCDMSIESGPTQLLPFSQSYTEGYLAFIRPDFQEFFLQNYVQLPLEKGDLLFFNPALMHSAGDNKTTDIYRLVNLLQISSAFGRAMESVDRHGMSLAVYPALLRAQRQQELSMDHLYNVVACCAEGYAFPTNLDRDPPIGGLAPKSQADLLREAMRIQASMAQLEQDLDGLKTRRLTV